MQIYLLRHAIAVPRGTPGYPNDDRPLTDEGIKRMMRASLGLARIVPRLDSILSSPLVRAHHTARLVSQAMECEDSVQLCEALMPGAPEREIYEALRAQGGASRVMLVGHEPALGFFASSLLGAEDSVLEFRKGGCCRIHVSSVPLERPGKLIWHLTPRELRALAPRR